MTRWYRCPEVILMEKYNTKADLWSIGCIFAEVLKTTTNYERAEVPSIGRAVLFLGGSCYPITPHKKDCHVVEDTDQMVKIVKVLGPVTDFSFVENSDSREYV